MPPKIKITKEKIIDVAIDMVRREGLSALNARNIAQELHCSTQPIFSNFASMEELKYAVIEKAETIYLAFSNAVIRSTDYPPYKASGMAYIRFAKEERELFRLLYMRDRSKEQIPPTTTLGEQVSEMVESNTGLTGQAAQLFHLEVWAFVHGIATMITTEYCDLDEALISQMLTHAYQGLRKSHGVDV